MRDRGKRIYASVELVRFPDESFRIVFRANDGSADSISPYTVPLADVALRWAAEQWASGGVDTSIEALRARIAALEAQRAAALLALESHGSLTEAVAVLRGEQR